MKEEENKMHLPKLDDLFTIQEERDYNKAEKVEEIDISKLKNFPSHPFKVNNDEKMIDLVNSIKEHGILLPAIVRPKEDGTYELVSGHRRKRACELAGVNKMRCIVKDLTDDEATILMVDSNIQREEILPSEKAFAYKMKLEALKHQGKNIDLENTSYPMETKLRTTEKIGLENGDSATQVSRYIRLTNLIPELLEQVDNKRIAFRPAVELSYLTEENQYAIYNIFQYDEVTPSLSQAIVLKKLQQEGNLTEEKLESILQQEKPNQREHQNIKASHIKKYFRDGTTEDEMVKVVHKLLENYYHKWHDKNRDVR